MDTGLNQWCGRKICKPSFFKIQIKELQKVVLFALELADPLKLQS